MAKNDVVQNTLWELELHPYGKSRDMIDAGFGYCEDMWILPECAIYHTNAADDRDWNQQREVEDLRLLAQEEA